MGNLCLKFGKNRSTNYVTFLSTDAGRTDGRTDVYVILYSVRCICIALDRQLETLGYHMVKTQSLSSLVRHRVVIDRQTDGQNSHS